MEKEITNIKKRFKKVKRNVKGITLIALVVTIIVLLILAGVAINLSIGKNGIFSRAQDAASTWKNAETNEQLAMGIMEDWINENATGIEVEQVTDENPGVLEGTGTNTDPYTINSIEDLVFFSYDVREGNTYEGKTVKLGLSLDFNSTKSYVNPLRKEYAKYGYNGELKKLLTTGEGFKQIGTEVTDDIGSNSFNGIFDGNEKTIYNLYINRVLEGETKFIGLFGNNFGTIENLKLKNIKIQIEVTDASSYIGGIVGRNRGGNIYSCGVSGIILADGDQQSKLVGGITGFNREGEIRKCYNYANIKCTGYYIRLGGIAGVSTGGYITDSYNCGSIYANDNPTVIGGLIGEAYSLSTIERCYNMGNIIIEDANSSSMIAGIIAFNSSGLLNYVYNIGNLNINLNDGAIGGIVSKNSNNSNITNAYNLGEIYSTLTTNKLLGMLCGINEANIENSYSINFNNNKLFGSAGTNSNCDFKNESDMPNMLSILGTEYKEDTNNINNGYPILNWQ